MKSREAGKGDAPRLGADLKKYAEGWDRIFGSDKRKNICPNRSEINSVQTLCDEEATDTCRDEI